MPSLPKLPSSPREGPLPVTILSGFLGSGKTTLLKRLLENSNGLRIGALVNDVSAINIDGALVCSIDKAEEVIELENGCICCDLRDDLLYSLRNMAKNKEIDYCIVESTGVAEPRPVAETFSFPVEGEQDENGNELTLSHFARLDTCVTLVDARNFPETLESKETARERWDALEEADEADRDVSEILADQLEFADVVVVNKCDLIDDEQAAKVCSAVRAFNVGARIIRATHSDVELSCVVGTSMFDMEKAVSDARWMSALQEDESKNSKGELEEFGISTAVFRARRPFHPDRFHAAAEKLAKYGRALLRSKGFVWLASKNDRFGVWSQTGVVWSLVPSRNWFCVIPREEWPIQDPEFVRKVEMEMHEDPRIGDRRQELVFIGQGLKEKEIIEMLNGCLLNDEEMEDESNWSKFLDPFGDWEYEDEFDGDEEDEEDLCDDEDCDVENCEKTTSVEQI